MNDTERTLSPEQEAVIRPWIEMAKDHKAKWVSNTDRGDIHPTLFVEKDGVLLFGVITPGVDKHQVLNVAAMCRNATACDAMTFILDAHMATTEEKDVNFEEWVKNWKPGELQRMCDEENACELGLISDCIICHRISAPDNKIIMATLPYAYHGKEAGVPLTWTTKGKFAPYNMGEEEGAKLTGFIPDALRQIMSAVPAVAADGPLGALKIAERLATLEQLRNKGNKEEVNLRMMYYATRAVFSIITDQGFLVLNYGKFDLPFEEWAENYKEAIDRTKEGKKIA